MAPLTKDSLEVSSSITEASVSETTSQPKQASGQLRSDAVSMEIPVKVHGSRITEVVREVTPHTEPFEEQTTTMIVFPQGGVLRMSTAVNPGQMLVLTNLKSRQDAICRVVKIRTFSNAQGYVEIEFTHSQPGYWGVNFPSDVPASAGKTPSASTAIPREQPQKEAVPDVSWAPARPASIPAPKPPVSTTAPHKAEPEQFDTPEAPPSRTGVPESSFISIGSQEQVQPAASSTLRSTARVASPIPPAPRIEPEREVRIPEPPKKSVAIDFPPAPPAVPVPSLSMSELLGDALATPDLPSAVSSVQEPTKDEELPIKVESSARISHSTFGSLSGGATLGGVLSQDSENSAESILDITIGADPAAHGAPRQNNWLLIAVCIFVLFACAGAGVFYFRHQLPDQKSDQKALVTSPAAGGQTGSMDVNQPRLAPTVPVRGGQPASNLIPTTPTTVTAPGTTITVTASPAAIGATAPSNPALSATQPAATATKQAPSVKPDVMAETFNAHPVSAQRADASGTDAAAPSIDPGAASASPDAPMPVIPSSENVAAPPPPDLTPEGPIKVGGEVKEPRLITFKQPDYPLVAKQAHIQGDVVIETQIDKAGNVVHMKAISGPVMLRQPALDALRRWKYAPSTLNGQPIAIEMMVTLKFRM
jgi:TonB family protein